MEALKQYLLKNFEALTSWPPYRDRWDNRAVFSEMGRNAKQGEFNPKVLESLGKLIGVES
jgi:response regulator RpfG family c-di-GMP phosphodiesterase